MKGQNHPKEGEHAVEVCLVSPPSRVTSQIVPYSLLSLIGWVEERGYRTQLVDVKRPPYFDLNAKDERRVMEEIVDRAVASRAPLIGLTAFTSDLMTVMEMARMIRQRSTAKIMIGGVHATLAPDDFFALPDSPIDIVVVGDGEETLTELLEAQRRGSSLEAITGLVFRDNGKVVHSKERQGLIDLTSMPLFPYHKLDMDYYLSPQRNLLRFALLSGVHLLTARGCPYFCAFCANRMRKVRNRSVDQVIEELQLLKEVYDIDGFYIMDDTFTIKADRVLEFCEKLKALNLGMVWGMQGRVNQFNDRVYGAIKDAGCLQIDFGVESGSQEALNRMKKGIKVEDTERIFARCRQDKIRTYANIMFNTPGETEQDVQDTISLMKRIKATSYGINLTVPLIGTEIYQRYVKPPLTLEEYRLFGDSRTYHSIVDPRFRLAVHNLNLESLYVKQLMRFSVRQTLSMFSLQPAYLRCVSRSKRKWHYPLNSLHFLGRQLNTYLGYIKIILKNIFSWSVPSKQAEGLQKPIIGQGESQPANGASRQRTVPEENPRSSIFPTRRS